MIMRYVMLGLLVGGFILSDLSFDPQPAAAAQTTVKKKKKKADQERQQHQHGKKKYPWGEPNAGWDDRCIFYFDAYNGWVPPFCRPYGRMR